jgi:hypothetical protein
MSQSRYYFKRIEIRNVLSNMTIQLFIQPESLYTQQAKEETKVLNQV